MKALPIITPATPCCSIAAIFDRSAGSEIPPEAITGMEIFFAISHVPCSSKPSNNPSRSISV